MLVTPYLFVKIFYHGKILRFQNVIMRCNVTPVIFAYETKLNILQRKFYKRNY
jgi:nitrate reductase gamma subunit